MRIDYFNYFLIIPNWVKRFLGVFNLGEQGNWSASPTPTKNTKSLPKVCAIWCPQCYVCWHLVPHLAVVISSTQTIVILCYISSKPDLATQKSTINYDSSLGEIPSFLSGSCPFYWGTNIGDSSSETTTHQMGLSENRVSTIPVDYRHSTY